MSLRSIRSNVLKHFLNFLNIAPFFLLQKLVSCILPSLLPRQAHFILDLLI